MLVGGQPQTITESDLVERLRTGALTETTQVWRDGDWRLLRDVPELSALLRAAEPAPEPIAAVVDPGPATPQAVRVPMAYVPEGFPLGLSTQNGRGASLAELPDEEYRVLPARTGERMFGSLWFGEKTLLCVLNLGGKNTPAQLYLDRNGDGDLTNDPGPFSPEGEGSIPAHYTIELPWADEKGAEATKYRMWWYPSNMGGTAFYAACHRSGRFPYGDVPMVLFDANADGDYANDALYIDWNRDGTAAPTEAYLMGEPIPVGSGHVRCVTISHGGSEVAFASL